MVSSSQLEALWMHPTVEHIDVTDLLIPISHTKRCMTSRPDAGVRPGTARHYRRRPVGTGPTLLPVRTGRAVPDEMDLAARTASWVRQQARVFRWFRERGASGESGVTDESGMSVSPMHPMIPRCLVDPLYLVDPRCPNSSICASVPFPGKTLQSSDRLNERSEF